MDIDATIEQLAFGKTTPKLSRCIGIYLSPEVIYVSEVRVVKGKVTVDHLVRVPVPVPDQKGEPTTSPTLVTEFLSDIPKLSALIRQAISQLRWNSKDAVVSLSHHLGLLRYFTMPAVDRKFWKSAIPLEAKKFIPVPLEMLSLDYQVVPMPPGPDRRPRQASLVACVPTRNLPHITALMDSLGLRTVGIEVAPCSVLRLWNSIDPGKVREPFCHVHFDGGNVRVLLSDKGLPVFFREVFLGPEAYVSDQRKVDLGGCVAFAQKQLGVGNLSQLVISGSTPEMAAWKDVFSQELSMTAEMHDTCGMLGIKGGDWGGFASIGAGLRFIVRSTIMLELSIAGKISDAERLAVKYMFAVSILGLLAMTAVGGAKELQYRWETKSLKSLKPQPDIATAFQGKSPAQIEAMIHSMKQQSGALPDLSGGPQTKMVLILKAIVDSLPEKVWLNAVDINNPLKGGQIVGGRGQEINLSGNAMGSNIGDEQQKCLDFKENLSRNKLLSSVYNDFQIDVRRQPPEAQGAQAGEADGEYKRKQEQRTSFTMTVKKK